MFCKNCGSEITLGGLFCPKCGARLGEAVPETGTNSAEQTINSEPAVNSDFSQTSENDVEPQVSTNQEPVFQEQNYGANYGANYANDNAGANYGANYSNNNVGANYASNQNVMTPVDSNHELGVFGEVNHVGGVVPPSKPKRKLKKLLLTVCLPIVLILAIAVSVYANPVWRNSFLRMVMSDKAYFKYVMANNIESYMSDLSADFKMVQDLLNGKKSVNASAQVELGEGLKDLAAQENEAGMVMLISMFDSVGFNIDAGRNDDKYGLDLGLMMDGEELVKAGAVLADDGVYITAPELNDSSAYIPMGYEISGLSDALDKLTSIFPSDKVVTNIITRYSLCMVNNVSNISEKDITISAGGVKQEAVGMTVELDGESLIKISEACLKELKKDKDIKGIIKDACDNGVIPDDFDDVYDEFLSLVDEGLEELEFVKDEGDLDYIDEMDISVRFVANNRGKLIGMDVNAADVQFKFYNTENGGKYGTLVSLEADGVEVAYESTGTSKGGKYNSEGSIRALDMDIVNIVVENVDKAKYDRGIFNGKITITPGDGAKTLMTLANMNDSAMDSVMSYLEDMELIIEATAQKDYNGELTITANYAGEKLIALKLGYGIGEKKACDVPDSYTTLEDDYDMEQWAEECMENLAELDSIPFALRYLISNSMN